VIYLKTKTCPRIIKHYFFLDHKETIFRESQHDMEWKRNNIGWGNWKNSLVLKLLSGSFCVTTSPGCFKGRRSILFIFKGASAKNAEFIATRTFVVVIVRQKLVITTKEEPNCLFSGVSIDVEGNVFALEFQDFVLKKEKEERTEKKEPKRKNQKERCFFHFISKYRNGTKEKRKERKKIERRRKKDTL